MVLEDLFNPSRVRRRPYLAFIFGFIFTFISFFISTLFFDKDFSIAVIFLTSILLIPTLIKLLKMEEKVERQYGISHFFRNHKEIFEVYIFSFLGVFSAFVILGLILYQDPVEYGKLFSFQDKFLQFKQGLTPETVQNFVQGNVEQQDTAMQILSLFSHSLLVLVICFLLSFFYGASAIFLIILNGSVFASFIVFVIETIAKNTAQGIQAFLFFMIHLLPEVSGFLVAAIAGGVVSKAVMAEKMGSNESKNVFKDATILMLIAIALVLVGALLELLVTSKLFQVFF